MCKTELRRKDEKPRKENKRGKEEKRSEKRGREGKRRVSLIAELKETLTEGLSEGKHIFRHFCFYYLMCSQCAHLL